MVSHDRDYPVFRMESSQHIHMRQYLQRMSGHQIAGKGYEIRIFRIYPVYYFFQSLSSRLERTQVHV